ncbi:MAG: glycosyltransferase family 4 protein [Chloroflexota bacterium]|nr:glycosyltransferase family 4 protein [Chloroflexota bacterium]
MRIVMIGPFGMQPRGTMGVRALPMAKALAARGHTMILLLPPWQNLEDSGRCWEENGVRVENISLPPRIPLLFHALTAFRLARRALAFCPDVVHLFKPKAYSGLTHWLLARLPRPRRPRLVVDTDDWEGPGGWNEIGGYTPAQRRFFAWQERWGLTHADAVTVASRTLESLVWALGVPRERVFYVPNGVEQEERGKKQEARILHPASCILLYTRFFEFPVSRVIEVLQRIRERIPEARLLVVGKGLFGEEEELFRLAVQSGLTATNHASRLTFDASRFTDDIAYCGWVPPDTLPTYFAQANVAIYPFDDTLVNRAKCAVKLQDLLAAGVPVVAEAVGQNREFICHGETGWLVEPGDVASFADAVVRLLGDVQLRTRLGHAAAQDMRERFEWARLVEEVERAYG